MFRRGLFRVLVIALLIFGALMIGSYAGWSQGYVSGLAVGNAGEGSVVVPYAMPYGYGFHPFFWGIGLFFKLAFFFFFFMIIAKFFGFFAWRMAGGPGGHWKHHRHWHPEARPPWATGEEGPSSERSKDDEADVEKA